MAGQFNDHQTSHLLELAGTVPTTFIVVSKDGSDAEGLGSWSKPYKTVTKAFAMASAVRSTIYVLAGEYEEALTLTWPAVNGVSLVGLGPVSISNANAAAQVLLIAPGTAATSSFGVGIKDVNIDADTQIGINVDNAAMTKKLNLYLDGVSAEMSTSGESLDIDGTVSGQAIRVYMDGCDWEGLVNFAANDAGSRLRCTDTKFTGGVTVSGSVAAELSLRNCAVKTSTLSVDAAWNLTYVGCVYATDADPAVYTEFVNAYST